MSVSHLESTGGVENQFGQPGTARPLSIYYTGRPTLVPFPKFDPDQDADDIRRAMHGAGMRFSIKKLNVVILRY